MQAAEIQNQKGNKNPRKRNVTVYTAILHAVKNTAIGHKKVAINKQAKNISTCAE